MAKAKRLFSVNLFPYIEINPDYEGIGILFLGFDESINYASVLE